jgi:hypothetical protein
MRGAIPPSPYVFMARCLVKHRDKFTFLNLICVAVCFVNLHFICLVIGIQEYLLLTFMILTLRVKRQGREADCSPSSSAEVKECVALYLHPQYASMAWCSVGNRVQGQLLSVFCF